MSGLIDPRLVRLLGYWVERRGVRTAPRRADIDPLDIPDLLPILNLLDVLHDPLRFRHRLVGTEVVQALGRDATGRFVGEGLYGSAAQEVFDSLARLTREVRPFRRHSRLSWNGQEWLLLEALELPLLGDDGRVAMILRGNCFSLMAEAPAERLSFEPLDPDQAATGRPRPGSAT